MSATDKSPSRKLGGPFYLGGSLLLFDDGSFERPLDLKRLDGTEGSAPRLVHRLNAAWNAGAQGSSWKGVWESEGVVERLALLFDDGGLLVAETDGTIDGETVASVRADLPKAGRLGRVRVSVLEIEPAPASADHLPASVTDILRAVRDTPNLAPKFRDEIDRVLSGRAA